MSKKIYERTYIIGLFECYGQLLTKSQREIFDGYYGCDLSLGEIAENRGISRSAVDDSLTKSCAKLEDFEAKLHYYEKKNKYFLNKC